MSDHRATSPISVPHQRQRRPSLASMSLGSQPNGASSTPINASAGRQPRRLSITTLGLAGSPTQTSPFGGGGAASGSGSASANGNGYGNGNGNGGGNGYGNGGGNGNGRHVRGGSLSSSAGSTADDLISEEGEASAGTTPSALARRMSFGAQALRDVRRGSVNTDERSNWSESLRTRAERAPSISNILSGSPTQNQTQGLNSRQLEQHRAASIAHMEMEPPVREIPRQPKHNKPDFFQEKILRGDFMD